MVYRYYNLTNITNQGNQTTILTFVEGVNTTMNYVPMTLMLVAIYVILLVALMGKGFDPFKAFAATSFAMMVIALITYPMNLIAGGTLLIFVILCPLSVFILWVWGGRSI